MEKEQQDKALLAFRARLAGDVKPFQPENSESQVHLWGVELSLSDPKVDVVLLKFLRARDFKVDDAAKMLVDCLKWRKDFGVDGILKEQFSEEIESLGYIHKHDKHARPVMYNTYGNINTKAVFEDNGGIDKFVRWRVKLMEQAIQLLDMQKVEDMVVVHDYAGASFLKIDKHMKLASKTLIKLFQDNYPELLATKFFVNIPWFFETVYTMVSKFVSEKTKKKFVICSKGSIRERMLHVIDVECLPTEFIALGQVVIDLYCIYGGLSKTGRATSSTTGQASTAPPENSEKSIEITIDSRSKHEIRDLTEDSDDIGFSVHFQAEEATKSGVDKKGGKVVVEKSVRLEQHAGMYTATNDGIITLLWDNSYSFFTKKTIFYKVFVVEKTNNFEPTLD